jgi:hypothetical protein
MLTQWWEKHPSLCNLADAGTSNQQYNFYSIILNKRAMTLTTNRRLKSSIKLEGHLIQVDFLCCNNKKLWTQRQVPDYSRW